MKKITYAIFPFLSIFLLSACTFKKPSNYDSTTSITQEESQTLNDAATLSASPEIHVPKALILNTVDCVGAWRKAPNEKEG